MASSPPFVPRSRPPENRRSTHRTPQWEGGNNNWVNICYWGENSFWKVLRFDDGRLFPPMKRLSLKIDGQYEKMKMYNKTRRRDMGKCLISSSCRISCRYLQIPVYLIQSISDTPPTTRQIRRPKHPRKLAFASQVSNRQIKQAAGQIIRHEEGAISLVYLILATMENESTPSVRAQKPQQHDRRTPRPEGRRHIHHQTHRTPAPSNTGIRPSDFHDSCRE